MVQNASELQKGPYCHTIVPAHEVPALMAMAPVFLVCALLIAYEAVRFREARERIRHA